MAWLTDYVKYYGRVVSGEVDITSAIPIGTHLKQGRYDAYRGYNGRLKEVGAVQVNGYIFIVDGRHRARASLDDGRSKVPAKIKISDDKGLENHLFGISNFFLDEIPILMTNLDRKK